MRYRNGLGKGVKLQRSEARLSKEILIMPEEYIETAYVALISGAGIGLLVGIYHAAETLYARIKLYFWHRKKNLNPREPTEIEAEFYEQALAESKSGNRDSSLWAKAYAEGADEEMSKRLYVKFRAEALARKADSRSESQHKKTSILDSIMGFLWTLCVLAFWVTLAGIALLVYFDQ